MVNPYQVRDAETKPVASPPAVRHGSIGPVIVALLFLIAALIGFTQAYVPTLRSFFMPRFGWIGLVLCLNPVIFLWVWTTSQTRSSLVAAAWMCLSIAGIQSILLLWQGTVDAVSNEFADRLHSSWLWSVLLFVLVAMYLLFEARRAVALVPPPE